MFPESLGTIYYTITYPRIWMKIAISTFVAAAGLEVLFIATRHSKTIGDILVVSILPLCLVLLGVLLIRRCKIWRAAIGANGFYSRDFKLYGGEQVVLNSELAFIGGTVGRYSVLQQLVFRSQDNKKAVSIYRWTDPAITEYVKKVVAQVRPQVHPLAAKFLNVSS